jgi:hypothetical protein
MKEEDWHIDTKRLFFEAAGELRLTPQETWHLRVCVECKELRKVFRHLDSLAPKKSLRDLKKSANF